MGRFLEVSEGLVRDEEHVTDDLIRRVQARGVSIAVFVIDACWDNPLAAIGGRGIGAARGLAQPETPEGVLVIHSASPGEQALDRLSESDPNPNSVFTRELLPLLREKSLGHLAIAKRLQTAVRKVARTVGHQQFPDYIDRVAGEIVLHPALPVSFSVQPEVTLPKYTSVRSEPRQAEERQASTDGSNSVAAVIPPSMESTLAAPDSKAPSAPGATSLFQRAIHYEENPAQPQQPRASGGRAVWRLDNVNAGQGQSLETVVRATVEVPDAGMTLTMLIRRNTEATTPTSHTASRTVELTFSGTRGQGRTVRDVGLLQFKNEEGTRGTPVGGVPVPIRDDLFLIGLSSMSGNVKRNTGLLTRRR
jgi:hypothetical protein